MPPSGDKSIVCNFHTKSCSSILSKHELGNVTTASLVETNAERYPWTSKASPCRGALGSADNEFSLYLKLQISFHNYCTAVNLSEWKRIMGHVLRYAPRANTGLITSTFRRSHETNSVFSSPLSHV